MGFAHLSGLIQELDLRKVNLWVKWKLELELAHVLIEVVGTAVEGTGVVGIVVVGIVVVLL